MHNLIRLTAVGFFVFIVWIIYLANTHSSSVFFVFIRSIPYGDKLGHVSLFGFLTLLSIVALNFRSFSIYKLRIYYGVGLVLVFVVAEEMSQIWIPSRTFDFFDLAADISGICLAASIAYLAKERLISRK